MQYKIRKGLEIPLLINGLNVGLFYMYMGILVGIAILLIVVLLSAMDSGNWGIFIVFLALSLFCLIFLLQYFRKKSKISSFDFKKKESTISNKDILNLL